jgi:hypothetical protein
MILGDYTGWFYAILFTTLGVIAVGYAIGLSVYFKYFRARPEAGGAQRAYTEDDLSLA